jgi:hypothetical protein
MTTLSRIRQKVVDRDYYLSSHAEEEMADDRLERKDIENAIIRGKVDKRMTRDVRGTRYRIAGPAEDGRLVRVVCRFKEVGDLMIITVYAVRGAL